MTPDQIIEHSWVTNLSLYKHWVEFQNKPHFKAQAQFLERTSKLSSHHGPPHTTTGSSGHLNSWPYPGVQKFFNHRHSFVVTFKNFWKYEKYSVMDSSVNLGLDFVNCLRAGLVKKTRAKPVCSVFFNAYEVEYLCRRKVLRRRWQRAVHCWRSPWWWHRFPA